MLNKPRLKDSKKSRQSDIHSLGEFPKKLIYEISKWIVYHFAVGNADISGENWGDIFAKGVNGSHLSSPVGLADVVWMRERGQLRVFKIFTLINVIK